MKILITGIQGYIGTVLGYELNADNFQITGLDTGYYKDANLYELPNFKEPKLINKDIRNVTKVDLEGVDAVIHLAELSNDPLGENDPELTYKINHEGTLRLATLTKEMGIKRFIYFSSCSVYGASDKIVNEESVVSPITAYAKSKVLNENALLKLGDKDFSPIIFRNATVFGASPRLRFDLVVNNLSGLAYSTHNISMDSDGTPWRPFVHILDVCQAVKLALLAPIDNIKNQIINIGDTNSNYQIKDIAKIISEVYPGCTVKLNPNGADKRNYRVNFDKIKTVLPGFSCKYDIKYGAIELYEIFKKVNLTENDFKSRLYTRLKQIKYLVENNKINKEFFWN